MGNCLKIWPYFLDKVWNWFSNQCKTTAIHDWKKIHTHQKWLILVYLKTFMRQSTLLYARYRFKLSSLSDSFDINHSSNDSNKTHSTTQSVLSSSPLGDLKWCKPQLDRDWNLKLLSFSYRATPAWSRNPTTRLTQNLKNSSTRPRSEAEPGERTRPSPLWIDTTRFVLTSSIKHSMKATCHLCARESVIVVIFISD